MNPNEVKMYTDFRKKGVSRAAIEADKRIVRKDARKSWVEVIILFVLWFL